MSHSTKSVNRGACVRGVAAVVGMVMACVGGARADLREEQVLVVYDSRIADSLAVAEYYAGSAKVPDGEGNLPGVRPGVRVVDLAGLPNGGVNPAAADISYANFVLRLRDPLRAYLNDNGLTYSVRAIVLTKGIPHRIQDTDNANLGDNPGAVVNEFNAGDITYAAVDSELALLWQTLNQGENGGAGDSRADGMIINPYHRQSLPISAYTTRYITNGKVILNTLGVGQIRSGSPANPGLGYAPTQISPGDIYLVTRLDGPSVEDVRGMIDRAQGIVLDLDTAGWVLDESGSNGFADGSQNSELDNQAPTVMNGGDDYELTRDTLRTDGRVDPARISYNNGNGPAQFLVGPRLSFDGQGIVVSDPLVLLASEGNNHGGGVAGSAAGGDPPAGNLYGASFNYAPGAFFNSIESYNGRAFGGLGGLIGQQQVSDAIAAGVTFGIGNVWEPLALSIGDNVFMVRNFYLGNMTFAEAVYTAMPVLSWQQIALGDPLARVTRLQDDLNGDGTVNIEEMYEYAASPRDLNRSGAADGADAALIEASVRGLEGGKAAVRQR